MRLNLFFAIIWVLLSLVCGFPVEPELPSNDPFYLVPQDIEKYSEGEIIRSRPSPAKLRGVFQPINIQDSWQYLVRTTNSRGKPTAVVTSVLKPYNADKTKVLSYQFAQDSPSINCSPSYSILHGASMNTLILQLEMYVISLALARGWYVVTPDHEGPNSAFAIAKIAGKITLDSIRAVLKTEDTTGIDPKAKVALWGYSGGTVPTSWAAILQPKYAPELSQNLVGAACGGWLTNLTNAALAMDGKYSAGLIPLAIHGLMNEYPELSEKIASIILNEDQHNEFLRASNYCLLESFPKFAFKQFFKGNNPIFSIGTQIFEIPEIKRILTDNVIGLNASNGVPKIPLFVYQGMQDEIIPYVQAERGFERLCALGVESFELALSKNTGHIGEMLQGVGAALKWVEDRFAGLPPKKGCVKEIRETNLAYEGADLSFYKLFRASWESILGWEVGRFASVAKIPLAAQFVFDALRGVLEALGPVPMR